MTKQIFIITTLVLIMSLAGCRTRNYNGYGYSYTPVYTNTTTVPYTAPVNTYAYTYTPNYDYTYYPYNYSYYYYSSPYYYPYVNRHRYRYGRSCQIIQGKDSKLDFSVESPDGSVTRNIAGDNLRTQTLDQRTEVEYGNSDEKLSLFTDQAGKAYVSGKVSIGGKVLTLDPKTETCSSIRSASQDNPQDMVATFNCTGGNFKITAKALIPKYLQNSIDPKTITTAAK